MRTITIREPIWSSKSVGLCVTDMPDDEKVSISISYRDSHGDLVYPDRYIMDVKKIKQYPIQIVGSKTEVHLVPIVDLKTE